MPQAAQDVEEIRRQMAQIRRELHEDVQEVVASAGTATDWRAYVKRYPWLCLGAAFAIGYLIVPKRRKPAGEMVVKLDATPKTAEKTEQKAKRRGGIIGAIFGFVGPLVFRTAQNYAAQYLEQWLQTQQMMAGQFAGPGPGPAPGGPGGSRPGTAGRPGP